MREILFRGKRFDNGEWVYGNLIQEKHFEGIKTVISLSIAPYGSAPILVKTQNVGQFSGVYDKNGNLIFEGDIVVVTFHDGYIMTHFIEYNTDHFTINWHSQPLSVLMSIGCFFEVIGNIYDNPELLNS